MKSILDTQAARVFLSAPESILLPSELFDEWHLRFHHLKRAHYRAAWWYEKRTRLLSRFTIILAVAAPPLAFVVPLMGAETRLYWGALAVVVAAFAAILASLQIFGRDAECAERHRAAGGTYAKLEGDVEELCAFMPADRELLQRHAQELRQEWHRLTGSSPVIPEFIFNAVEKEIEKRPAFRSERPSYPEEAYAETQPEPDYRRAVAAADATAAALG